TAEEPPVSARPADAVVAVDIGWRAFGDAIRVATAVDQDGIVQELRLPLDAARAHERRHHLPYSGWRDLAVLDVEIAALLEAAKAKLRLLSISQSCRDLVLHLVQMRQGGLVCLLR